MRARRPARSRVRSQPPGRRTRPTSRRTAAGRMHDCSTKAQSTTSTEASATGMAAASATIQLEAAQAWRRRRHQPSCDAPPTAWPPRRRGPRSGRSASAGRPPPPRSRAGPQCRARQQDVRRSGRWLEARGRRLEQGRDALEQTCPGPSQHGLPVTRIAQAGRVGRSGVAHGTGRSVTEPEPGAGRWRESGLPLPRPAVDAAVQRDEVELAGVVLAEGDEALRRVQQHVR